MERLNDRQRKQFEQRSQRQQYRAQIMFFCCLIVVASGYFFLSPGLASFSGTSQDYCQQSSNSQETVQPVMPRGYLPRPEVRDPFAVPKEFQPVVAPVPPELPPVKSHASVSGINSSSSNLPESQLMLVGVVSGGGQKVAIIKNGSNSRTYQIEDFVGPYQLLSVEKTSVTLWGPQGEKVLTLAR